jgi:diguanylate cyclase (GGDEF)-like protein/PAS domain S-box-containing protein
VSLDLARLVYPVTVGVLVIGYSTVPSVRPAAVAAIGVASVAGVGLGVARSRPQRWGAWLLIALAVVLLTVGGVVFTAMTATAARPPAYPMAPNVFYVTACLPLTVGLLWLGRPPLPSRDWPMILDTVGLSLAGSLVIWIVVVRPAVTSLHLTGMSKATAIASWVGFVAVLAASARVVLAWRANPALALLGAGVVAFLAANFFSEQALVDGTWSTGSPANLGFFAFSIACGTAALTSSMAQVTSAPYAHHQLGPGRLTMLAVALLVAPTALLVEATSGPVTTGVAIAVVSAAVGVLLLVRLSLSARAYRRHACRDQAVRAASRALVVATTDGEVVAGIRTALVAMLPAGALCEVRLIDRHAGGPQLSPHSDETAVVSGLGAVGELTVPVHGQAGTTPVPSTAQRPADGSSGRVLEFTAPMAELVELSPDLQALAYQAGSALDRIRLVARLRAEEREHYFRTLVLTNTDVTLISRAGRVDYATPSAQSMFGRDVGGEKLDDLVHRHPPGHDEHGQPEPRWSDTEVGAEGYVYRPDGGADTVLMHRRDLTDDPTVNGVVTTLRDVTTERNLQRELAHRASHDALTGLANAQLFGEELRADGAPDADRRTPAGGRAALFVDLDDFKTVNDTYGHWVGDHLLAEVARRIESCLRDGDIAARLGGDEFAVLLRGVPDVTAARAVAQRIADALARPASVGGIGVDCQASIGLAYTARRGESDSLLRKADTALYIAKTHGKGRWWQYRDGMPTPTRRQIDARRRLEDAVDSDRLKVLYQPIVELASGYAIGFEALIRLDDADGSMSPRELITAAEDMGLITTVGEWVLGRALADAIKLNPPGTARPRHVSVNVSARQLRQPDFVDTVRAQMRATGADPSLLVLEITENLLVDGDDRAWAFLADLRRDGIRVAIDDYGTGYASLSYLRQPGIDIVKIDQSFLTDVTSPRSRILLRAVTSLCAQLGLDQIAEGVHNATSRDVLLAVGCRYGQGFFYARAMPIDEAIGWQRASARNSRH